MRLSAVVAVMVATMLLFRFERHKKPARKDLRNVWAPLVLVDLVIVEFLFGLVFWYAARCSCGLEFWIRGDACDDGACCVDVEDYEREW